MGQGAILISTNDYGFHKILIMSVLFFNRLFRTVVGNINSDLFKIRETFQKLPHNLQPILLLPIVNQDTT